MTPLYTFNRKQRNTHTSTQCERLSSLVNFTAYNTLLYTGYIVSLNLIPYIPRYYIIKTTYVCKSHCAKLKNNLIPFWLHAEQLSSMYLQPLKFFVWQLRSHIYIVYALLPPLSQARLRSQICDHPCIYSCYNKKIGLPIREDGGTKTSVTFHQLIRRNIPRCFSHHRPSCRTSSQLNTYVYNPSHRE